MLIDRNLDRLLYLAFGLAVLTPLSAQLDTFTGTLTYEIYQTVEPGNHPRGAMLQQRMEGYGTVVLYVNGPDTLYHEAFDADGIRKTISKSTVNTNLTYFDRTRQFIDFSSLRGADKKVDVQHRRVNRPVDSILQLPCVGYHFNFDGMNGTVSYILDFPFALPFSPTVADRIGLYYDEAHGLIGKEELHSVIDQTIEVTRFIELIGYEYLPELRVEFPDTSATYLEEYDVEKVLPGQ